MNKNLEFSNLLINQPGSYRNKGSIDLPFIDEDDYQFLKELKLLLLKHHAKQAVAKLLGR